MKQYLIRTQLRDFNLAHAEAIMVAIIDEWFFRLNDYETEPRILEFVGDGLLAIPAEHFADRIAQVVWAVNEGFCPVGVVFFDLEHAPTTLHARDEQSYARWAQVHGGRCVDATLGVTPSAEVVSHA